MSELLLSNKKFVSDYLKTNRIKLKKNYGQNFVVNSDMINTIIESASLCEDDIVLEIGPGIGSLTEHILQSGASVVAVEIDSRFKKILDHHFGKNDNFKLISGDFLKKPVLEEVTEYLVGQKKNVKVVSNLPYYITTPIFTELLQSEIKFQSVVLTIQKEVAERLCSDENKKAYGAITVFTRYYGVAKIEKLFSPNSFLPTPKVWSAVFSFTPYRTKKYSFVCPSFFHSFVKLCFTERRKMLKNSVHKVLRSWQVAVSVDKIVDMLGVVGVDPNVRPEVLRVDEFLKIATEIWDFCPDGLRNRYLK